MKIKNYDDKFPYIIIDDYYDEEELNMIWEELEFLSYSHKIPRSSAEAGGATDNGRLLKRSFSKYIDDIYNDRDISNILNVNRKLYADDYKLMRQHPHWFFQNVMINEDFTQVSYYEDNDEYETHRDWAAITSLTWFYKEPKQFTGGNFYIGPNKIKIDCVNNRTLIMPSMIDHSVDLVKINEEKRNKRQGRYCLSQFGCSLIRPGNEK